MEEESRAAWAQKSDQIRRDSVAQELPGDEDEDILEDEESPVEE